MLRLLLARGASIDIRDNGGCPPVVEAARNGRPQALQLLAAAGADLCAVRLSQCKGAKCRELVSDAYRKARDADGESVDESDEIPKGYNRRQVKSTALWGPRKTPSSGKIKKKILRERKERKAAKVDAVLRAEKTESNTCDGANSDVPADDPTQVFSDKVASNGLTAAPVPSFKASVRRAKAERHRQSTTGSGAIDADSTPSLKSYSTELVRSARRRRQCRVVDHDKEGEKDNGIDDI